jgi:hypothetical protein
VSNDGVAASESSNLTHLLANYVPADQLCGQPDQWLRRVCRPEISDRSWSDTCFLAPTLDYYWVLGECPENTMCQNTFTSGADSKETIICSERPVNNNQPEADQQSGVYKISNADGSSAKNFTVPVDLETNLADASVNALIEGTN